jgi:hypothetical protein
MNERILELAEQARTEANFVWYNDTYTWSGWHEYFNNKFADLIRADEREACAKVCESYLSESPHSWGGTTMAAAIRARGQA